MQIIGNNNDKSLLEQDEVQEIDLENPLRVPVLKARVMSFGRGNKADFSADDEIFEGGEGE